MWFRRMRSLKSLCKVRDVLIACQRPESASPLSAGQTVINRSACKRFGPIVAIGLMMWCRSSCKERLAVSPVGLALT